VGDDVVQLPRGMNLVGRCDGVEELLPYNMVVPHDGKGLYMEMEDEWMYWSTQLSHSLN